MRGFITCDTSSRRFRASAPYKFYDVTLPSCTRHDVRGTHHAMKSSRPSLRGVVPCWCSLLCYTCHPSSKSDTSPSTTPLRKPVNRSNLQNIVRDITHTCTMPYLKRAWDRRRLVTSRPSLTGGVGGGLGMS
jgi:hypothetical protein